MMDAIRGSPDMRQDQEESTSDSLFMPQSGSSEICCKKVAIWYLGAWQLAGEVAAYGTGCDYFAA
jgi:hypothetical protein